MDGKEIFKLANELTEQDVLNVVSGWENDNEKESLNTYNILIELGDSKELACATTIAERINKKGHSEMYEIAYYS